MFRVLPFGLTTAPFVYTKLLKPLYGKEMEKQRIKSCKVVLQIDDGICVGATKQATSHAAKMIRENLTRAGFVINEEKSDFEPRQRVTWLGFSLDLNQGNISVPEQRTTGKSKESLS